MENQYQQTGGPRPTLPNATASLVLGICSIVLACAYVGLICGIIGLVISSKGRQLHRENSNGYEGWGQLNAGWIMSIIGTILGAIAIIWLIFVGAAVFSSEAWRHRY
jgi:hypothetical protein